MNADALLVDLQVRAPLSSLSLSLLRGRLAGPLTAEAYRLASSVVMVCTVPREWRLSGEWYRILGE